MNYYYLDAANQPAGPLPLEAIRHKAAAGEIPAQPMIAAVGSNRWQPLGEGGVAPAGYQFDSYLSDQVGYVLRLARHTLSANFLSSSLALATTLGHIVVLLGGAVGLVYVIYMTAYHGAWLNLSGGLVLIVSLICAQFAARLFFRVNDTLFTATRLASPALLDCLALLALFSTLSLLLGSIITCIRLGIWQPLPPAFLTAALWVYFATVALHPESVKVETAPHGAGEEVIGLLAFLMKATLKLLPLFFFLCALLGCVVIALSFFDLAEYVLNVVGQGLPLPRGFLSPRADAGYQGIGLVITACLMVPLAHLLFLALSLPLDIWRALLALPAKLDALRK